MAPAPVAIPPSALPVAALSLDGQSTLTLPLTPLDLTDPAWPLRVDAALLPTVPLVVSSVRPPELLDAPTWDATPFFVVAETLVAGLPRRTVLAMTADGRLLAADQSLDGRLGDERPLPQPDSQAQQSDRVQRHWTLAFGPAATPQAARLHILTDAPADGSTPPKCEIRDAQGRVAAVMVAGQPVRLGVISHTAGAGWSVPDAERLRRQSPWLLIDRDNNGRLAPADTDTADARETTALPGPVKIGEAWYTVECDPTGEALTLRSVASPMPTKGRAGLPAVGAAIPDVTLRTADGQLLRTTDWRGRVTVVDLWATWCISCIAGFPETAALRDEIRRLNGGSAELIALNVMDKPGAFDRWLQDHGGKHALAYATDANAGDTDGQSIAARWGLSALPTVIVLDRDGVVRYAASGQGREHQRAVRRVLTDLGVRLNDLP